jgi:hypothetical protein
MTHIARPASASNPNTKTPPRNQSDGPGFPWSEGGAEGGGMSLWWLSFKGGTTIVVRAETLVHARLLAPADEALRAHLFDAGFRVSPRQ